MGIGVFCVLLQQGKTDILDDAINFVSGLELIQECESEEFSLLNAGTCGLNI